MASSTDIAQAARLKEEGNKLYVLKDYAAAYSKYSEAISFDSSNAVLYANRGACMLGMEKYLDAAADCEKATKLDPLYTKAWARLGAAHKNAGINEESIAAYRRALSTLPVENLSETEKNIKRQCEADLDHLNKKVPKKHEGIIIDPVAANELPWKRALRMEAELQTSGTMSSAWSLLWAYHEFSLGVNIIKQIKRINSPSGESGYFGGSGGIEFLSNGIMTDPRVFHIDDQDFLNKYNMQAEFEVNRDKAFVNGGAHNLMAGVLKMKEEGGWDAVRPAVATTVRCWTMTAFLTDGLLGKPVEAVKFYDEAIQVLEWGQQVWRNASKQQRGAIFEDTFLRGVKCLRLDCYMKACMADPSACPLQILYQEAQDLLREVRAAARPSEPNIHPGFLLAHYVYPEGQALAMLGFYYRELGKAAQGHTDARRREAESCFQKSSKFYQLAGDAYPKDDENHVYYLCCAYDLLVLCGSYQVKEVLTIAEKVRTALPGMQRIWQSSALASARDSSMRRVLTAEDDLRIGIEKGKYTLYSTVTSLFGFPAQ